MQPHLVIRKRFIRSLLRVDRCSLSWASGRGLLKVYWGWTDSASAGDRIGGIDNCGIISSISSSLLSITCTCSLRKICTTYVCTYVCTSVQTYLCLQHYVSALRCWDKKHDFVWGLHSYLNNGMHILQPYHTYWHWWIGTCAWKLTALPVH